MELSDAPEKIPSDRGSIPGPSCVQLQNQSHVSFYRYFNVLYSGWYGQKVKIMKRCFCCCFFCYYIYVSISKITGV